MAQSYWAEGAALKLPGSACSMESFWEVLEAGKDCIVEVPRSRWDADEFYDSDPDADGKMYIREGGFVDDAEMFDGAFFRIGPAEAKAMDPQQRVLLEVAFEAFHNSAERGRLRWLLLQRVVPAAEFAGPQRQHLLRHQPRPLDNLQPCFLHTRYARPVNDSRHGVLLVSCGRGHRGPEPAKLHVQRGTGRRSEPDAVASRHCSLL